MPGNIYEVQLGNIFEGPMDLLVHLIRKNEVDIYDIPIALITDQYLKYLEWMKSMSIDLAGDFIVMAATLIRIKSRMLLPAHEEEDEDDPRLKVVRPLLEYLQMRSAAEHLAGKDLLGKDIFIRNSNREDCLIDRSSETVKVGLFDLIDAFQRILENVSTDCRLNITLDRLSINDRISKIVDTLKRQGSVTFDELFSANADKRDVVETFLAVLEMVRLRLVQVVQHVHTGIIRLFYGK